MPDCVTAFGKLEHLVHSLLPAGEPLWPHATSAVSNVLQVVDAANASIIDPDLHWSRFRDGDRIKAEVRTWLAWQREPGLAFGAAINDRILVPNSELAKNFLRWLGRLFSFHQLQSI